MHIGGAALTIGKGILDLSIQHGLGAVVGQGLKLIAVADGFLLGHSIAVLLDYYVLQKDPEELTGKNLGVEVLFGYRESWTSQLSDKLNLTKFAEKTWEYLEELLVDKLKNKFLLD